MKIIEWIVEWIAMEIIEWIAMEIIDWIVTRIVIHGGDASRGLPNYAAG
jgi:hypothetical protein